MNRTKDEAKRVTNPGFLIVWVILLSLAWCADEARQDQVQPNISEIIP